MKGGISLLFVFQEGPSDSFLVLTILVISLKIETFIFTLQQFNVWKKRTKGVERGKNVKNCQKICFPS